MADTLFPVMLNPFMTQGEDGYPGFVAGVGDAWSHLGMPIINPSGIRGGMDHNHWNWFIPHEGQGVNSFRP